METEKKALLHIIGVLVLMGSQGLLSVLAVRMGGYADAGILSLATSVGYVFAHIGNYGMRTYLITDMQKKYSQADFQLVQNIMIVFSTIFCAVYVLLMGSYQWVERGAIIMFVLYLCFNTFSDLLLGRLQLEGHLEINGYSNILRGTLGLAAFVMTYGVSGKLFIALTAMTLTAALVLIFYDCPQYRSLRGRVLVFSQGRRETILPLLKACFSIMLANILPMAITAVSRQILRCQLGQELLGIFSTVFLPTLLLTTVAPALNLATIPILAAFWHEHNRKKFSIAVLKNFLVVVVLALAGLAVAITFGTLIMRLLFGNEILNYMPLLYWAIFVTGLNALCITGNNVLISMRKGMWITVSAVIAVVSTAVLSEPMISVWGVYGAAYALMVAYGMQLACQISVLIFSIFRSESETTQGNGGEL